MLMASTSAYALDISIDDANIGFCGHTGIPFIDSNNRTQVPLRIIMESLSADVNWIQDTQTAVIEKDGVKVGVPIGKPYITVNDQQIKNDTVAIIKDDRIFMPIRSVIEAFGGRVAWKNETQTVIIDSQPFYSKSFERFPIPICLKSHPGDFEIATSENYPGNILILKIEKLNVNDTLSIYTDAVKIKVDIFEEGDHYIALLPIDLYATIGVHDISAIFNEGEGNEYKISRTFNIKNKAFKTQYLTASKSLVKSNRNDKSEIEFKEIVKPARTISNPTKLWEGDFIMPIVGRLTTDFAEIRYVNNVLSSSRHSGLDLAAPLGTKIQSPNNGKVTLAASGLLSTGNTIVIDHGMGLFTSYYHLNTMTVEVGEMVRKGDIIGTVGSTGFSTGAHLHYAVSIFNTMVNPYQPLDEI